MFKAATILGPDPTTITFREAQVIKKRLGFSLMSVFQNLASGNFDEDVLLGMFVLAKMRTDGDFDLDQILGLSVTDIGIEDDTEDEAEEAADQAPLDEGEADAEPAPAKSPAKKKAASSTT